MSGTRNSFRLTATQNADYISRNHKYKRCNPNPLQCHGDDFIYNTDNCKVGLEFDTLLYCMKKDTSPSICPMIAGHLPIKYEWNAITKKILTNSSNNEEYGYLDCTYSLPANADITADDITKIDAAFINPYKPHGKVNRELLAANTDAKNTSILTRFCSGTSTACDSTELENRDVSLPVVTTCSRFLSNDEAGTICRTFESSFGINPTDNLADVAKLNYCGLPGNEYVTECSCLNASLCYTNNILPTCTNSALKLFGTIESVGGLASGGAPVPPQCWYQPCQGIQGSSYLITSESFLPCPAVNICEIINNIEIENSIVLTGNESTFINCKNPGPGPTESFWERWKWWIIGSILFLLLVLFIIGMVHYRRKKRDYTLQPVTKSDLNSDEMASALLAPTLMPTVEPVIAPVIAPVTTQTTTKTTAVTTASN